MAGSSIFYIRLQVINKSYRQVLTPTTNLQLLLKLETFDKLRLITSSQIHNTKKCSVFNWFKLDRGNGNSRDLEPQSVNIAMLAA